MPYSLERKDETRRKIVRSAARRPVFGAKRTSPMRSSTSANDGGCAVIPQGTYRLAERFPRGSGDLQAARSQLRLPEKSSYKGGLLMMSHASIVMVRCPATGRRLSTGVEMDADTFKRLPEIRSQIKCPACGLDHDWSTRDA